jgi:glycosyltransferase involved in cell wall biosynthesis
LSRVVLICPEPIRPQQQGIGIRFLETARVLARSGAVTLWAPAVDGPLPSDFEVRRYPQGPLSSALGPASAVVAQGHGAAWYLDRIERERILSPPLALDLSDPFVIESLHYEADGARGVHARDLGLLTRQLLRADFCVVASEAQRHFTLGLLAALGRVGPREFRADPLLRRLCDLAPPGVSPPPGPTAGGLRRALPALTPDDQVVFFGGVYDWYDPELLLDAASRLSAPRLRLVFCSNPNPESTPQRAMHRLRRRCDEMGWTGQRAFFLPWFPYAERAAFLGDCDVAVALHRSSFEAELSFRSRVLEFLNSGLPVVATEGGAASLIVATAGAGVLVRPGDAAGVASALERLLSDAASRRAMGEAGREWVRREMPWERTLAPLVRFCEAPWRTAGGEPRDRLGWRTARAWLRHASSLVRLRARRRD